MAPGARGVGVRGGGCAPGVRRAQRGAELLRACGLQKHSPLGRIGAVAMLSEPQLRPLLLAPRHEEVEAAVAAQLDELQREPGAAAVGTLEEVVSRHALDGRHRVRLARAGLAEHKHGARPALARVAHELRGCNAVDLVVLGALPEHVVVLEMEVADVGGLEVGLKHAVVQDQLRGQRLPWDDGGHVVLPAVVLLMLEERPLAHKDPHRVLRRPQRADGEVRPWGGAFGFDPQRLLSVAPNASDEQLPVRFPQRVLVEHLAAAFLRGGLLRRRAHRLRALGLAAVTSPGPRGRATARTHGGVHRGAALRARLRRGQRTPAAGWAGCEGRASRRRRDLLLVRLAVLGRPGVAALGALVRALLQAPAQGLRHLLPDGALLELVRLLPQHHLMPIDVGWQVGPGPARSFAVATSSLRGPRVHRFLLWRRFKPNAFRRTIRPVGRGSVDHGAAEERLLLRRLPLRS
mmetsp:Transcript_87800/g.277565  ORF Transcript_87800/g.277565 Transcript_87800/m.277565 type:complete len:462 (-) Transcript_87800:384-1769(-)